MVAIAVATDRRRSQPHRIVRLAAVPCAEAPRRDRRAARHGGEPDRQAARSLHLLAAANVNLDDLNSAPPFSAIVTALREFVGDDDVHTYGADLVRAFLDAELPAPKRPGWPTVTSRSTAWAATTFRTNEARPRRACRRARRRAPPAGPADGRRRSRGGVVRSSPVGMNVPHRATRH